MAKLLVNSLIGSGILSENLEKCVLILNCIDGINESIRTGCDKYINSDVCEEESIETLEQIHEYLGLVRAGITQFFEELSKKVGE